LILEFFTFFFLRI